MRMPMRSRRRRSTSEPDRAADGQQSAPDPERQEELAFTHCLRRLTAAPRTEAELTESMRDRGYPAGVIDTVLSRLRAARYVDDRELARMWVESRARTRGLAPPVLRAELLGKGVPDDLIADALDGLDDEVLDDQARRIIRRKLAATAHDFDSLDRAEQQKVTRRLVGMLARKGHSSGAAYAVVREVIDEQREAG